MPQTPASHHTIWVSYNHKEEEEEEKRKNISKPQKEEATNSC